MNDPEMGINVAISPNDCLRRLGNVQNHWPIEHSHNEEDDDSDKGEADQRARGPSLVESIPGADE